MSRKHHRNHHDQGDDLRRYAPYNLNPRYESEPTTSSDWRQVYPSVPMQGTSTHAMSVDNPQWIHPSPAPPVASGSYWEYSSGERGRRGNNEMENFTSDGPPFRQHVRHQPNRWHQDNRGEYSDHRNSSARKCIKSNSPRDGNGHSRGPPFRQHGRHQPNRWHQDNRGEYSDHRNSSARKCIKSNSPRDGNRHSRSASRREAREQPVEMIEYARNERSAESSERSRAQQQENRIKRQNERELLQREREAYRKQCGLERGNHVITQILQTNENTGPSKQGTSGQPVSLVANYFQIIKRPTWQLYLYRVDITPDVDNRRFRSGLLNDPIKKFGPYLFDGTMLYILVKLNDEVSDFTAKGKEDHKTYGIKIKWVGSVSSDTYQYLHVWSLLLRKCEKTLGFHQIGRNHYDPAQKKALYEFCVEMWPGYVTAIHQHETEVLLCVDISTKVMRTETVFDIMRKTREPDGSYDKELLKNKVLGRTVRTSYSDKCYMIHDINFDETPETKFALKDGKKESYIEYFKRKYKAQIRYPQQPMLVVRSSQRQIRGGQSNVSQLVPELCFVTGFDDEMRKNHILMRKVANYTRMEPGERLKRAQGLIDRLQNTARNIRTETGTRNLFKEWNFQVDTKPVQLQGRQLDSEQILFGGQQILHSTDWNRFHIDEMYISVHLTNWVLIYPKEKTKSTHSFLGELQRTAAGMKYNIADPYMYAMPGNKYIDYQSALEKASMRDPQLIFCILTNSYPVTYGSIKKYCIETAAKPSQAMLIETYEGNDKKTIATKIAIQINCKLGGVPWMVQIHLKGLMTIGFDVYHQTKDISKRSRGAMVATMDMKIKQRFFSVVSKHISGVELSNDLKMLICKVLRQYMTEHGTLPEKILFYRDGIGNGQIPYVRDVEIANILEGLRSLYVDKRIPLTYIVVTKRINTRFFIHVPQSSRFHKRGGTQCQNPQPGTVVDDVITLPERHDFFLVSQSVKSGTVSPTNYNILHNNMGLSTDTLQRLTYQMTHLYYNNCATLAVPAVCHYAHRLAFMVGNYDLNPSNDDLQKTLYFL